MELHTMRPSGSRLQQGLIRSVVGVAVAAILVVLGPGTVAHAAPSPAEIEQQIDTKWKATEPIIEKHNTVKAQLAANRAKAAEIAAKIKPLELQLDAAMTKVSAISVQAYEGRQASAINAVLSDGTAANLFDKLTVLNEIARIQSNEVAGAIKLKKQYDAEKAPYDALVSKFGAQEAEIAALRKTAEAEIANLNQMRLVAYGTTGGTGSLRPAACPVSYDGSRGAKAAQVACAQIGKAYVFATAGPSTFDCSGLTKYAWGAQGVTLSHSSSIQYNYETTHISRAQLIVGDLVFFYGGISHVGLYVGDNWMVEAPNSNEVVHMSKIDSYPIYGFGRPG